MPLDATKVNDIIIAHSASHTDNDCEFCQFCHDLKECSQFLTTFAVSMQLMAYNSEDLIKFCMEVFISGLIVGVKLERTRVMEEEFPV